jgi:hypothetical protein
MNGIMMAMRLVRCCEAVSAQANLWSKLCHNQNQYTNRLICISKLAVTQANFLDLKVKPINIYVGGRSQNRRLQKGLLA